MNQKLERLRTGVHNLTCHAADMGYDGNLIRAIAIDQMRIGDSVMAQAARMDAGPLAEYAKIINFVLLSISAGDFNLMSKDAAAAWYREATAQPMQVVEGAPKDFFEGVELFNVVSGTVAAKDRRFDPKLVAFYTGMQCEELAEKLSWIFLKVQGQGVPGYIPALIQDLDNLGHQMKNGAYVECVAQANPVELLDGDIDLQVVSEGAILASGADGKGGRGEVNRSNLDKIVDGKVIRDPVSGKIQKPEGWTPPNLEPFIDQSHPYFDPDALPC